MLLLIVYVLFPVKKNFLESLVMSMNQSFTAVLLQGKRLLADQFKDSFLVETFCRETSDKIVDVRLDTKKKEHLV